MSIEDITAKTRNVKLFHSDSFYRGGFDESYLSVGYNRELEIELYPDGTFSYREKNERKSSDKMERISAGNWESHKSGETSCNLLLWFNDGNYKEYIVAMNLKGEVFLDGKRCNLEMEYGP